MSSLKIIDESASSCSSVSLNIIEEGASGLERGKFRGRAAVVTLGCAKNQVDSEIMLGVLENAGYEIVSDTERADVAIVNTCGFLQSSSEESVDAILDLAELKESGQLQRLIVVGCLVERHKTNLEDELPEVDVFLTTDELLKVGEAAASGVPNLLSEAGRPYFIYDETVPRHLATPSHFAYVKTAEGCNRPCAFCIIPQIRGAMRSRTPDSLVKEVRALSEQGVKEVNLLAQDLTAYGTDLSPKGDLTTLLKRLDGEANIDWIRLLYAYPIGVDKELMEAVRDLPSLCEYIDMPLQHSSEQVLRAMKRPIGRYGARRIVEFMKDVAPDVHLRTTFIVGFPGETDTDIEDLETFVREGFFTNIGVFPYSAEQGTPAAELQNQVPEAVKKERMERIMLAQQEVVARQLEAHIGKRIPVLIEGEHAESDLLIAARARFQAPEVDGTVIINDISESVKYHGAGQLGEVEITEAAGYDLVGTLVR